MPEPIVTRDQVTVRMSDSSETRGPDSVEIKSGCGEESRADRPMIRLTRLRAMTDEG